MPPNSKWRKVLEEAPVDDQSADIDWRLRPEAGSRRSESRALKDEAKKIEDVNPDSAAEKRIRAEGLGKHGDELSLFRVTKSHGVNRVPGTPDPIRPEGKSGGNES